MPLSATIATIIDRTKRIEICDTLHDAQNAATEDDLIKAGLPFVVNAYRSGVIDDALLSSDFTEATLNANGIYTTGSFAISNPESEVYILRDAAVTINLTGDANCKIDVMGGGSLVLIAGNTSYATIKAYDAANLNITINDDAMVNLETRDSSAATITQNNNSVFHLTGVGSSVITHNGNDTAYGLAKLTQRSNLTYTVTGTAQMVVTSYNSSQVFLT